MKIHDMLHLEIFSSCKVLTGSNGLDNEVDSVMILEATDIENWGRKNQVILTSYYALSDLDEVELKEFLHKMALIGSSALIVKMDRLIKMIPEELIANCLAFNIPLLKIEKDIAYEKIVLAIYRPILNYQSHILRAYYEIRQTFTKIEKNLPSFQRIMEAFQELIKRDCQLSIPEMGINIQLTSSKQQWVVLNAVPIKNREFTKNQYELLTLYEQQHSQECQALTTVLQHPYYKEIQLFVYRDQRSFDDVDFMIIENLVDILMEKLQMEYLLKKDRYTRLNSLANALLEGATFSLEEKNSLLQEAKMLDFPYYQGIAVSLSDEQLLAKRKEILHNLKLISKHMIYHETSNYLIALYNLREEDQPITPADVTQLFTATIEKNPALSWNITVSLLKEKEAIHEILSECLDTMKFNALFHVEHCLSIADLGIFRYFIQNNKLEEMTALIPQKLLELYEKEPALFTTLVCFLKNDKNYNSTANELFLHPKTVRYRMNKIYKLLQVDFDTPIHALNYQIGIYLLEWQEKRRN